MPKNMSSFMHKFSITNLSSKGWTVLWVREKKNAYLSVKHVNSFGEDHGIEEYNPNTFPNSVLITIIIGVETLSIILWKVFASNLWRVAL